MEVYYGSNERGTVVIYAPYYFAGMSLNGTSFRFKYDFQFLDKLAKKRLNLEDLAEKKWKIQKVDINYCYLDVLLDSFYSKPEEKTNERACEIIEMAEGFVINNYKRTERYEDEYSDWNSPEEFLQDKWWCNGLAPPFFDESIDWRQEDYLD